LIYHLQSKLICKGITKVNSTKDIEFEKAFKIVCFDSKRIREGNIKVLFLIQNCHNGLKSEILVLEYFDLILNIADYVEKRQKLYCLTDKNIQVEFFSDTKYQQFGIILNKISKFQF